MLIKHLHKREIAALMERGKTISTTSFTCRFTVEIPKEAYLSTYFISALSPKAQFKTATARNRVRRKIYGAINLLSHTPQKGIFKAVITPNKTILEQNTKDLQSQIMALFNKIGV